MMVGGMKCPYCQKGLLAKKCINPVCKEKTPTIEERCKCGCPIKIYCTNTECKGAFRN